MQGTVMAFSVNLEHGRGGDGKQGRVRAKVFSPTLPLSHSPALKSDSQSSRATRRVTS
jgi:hypothetical protein